MKSRLLAALVMSACAGTASAEALLDVTDGSGQPGQTVTVSVDFTNGTADHPDADTYDFQVNWDPNVLTLDSETIESNNVAGFTNCNTGTPGEIFCGATGTNPLPNGSLGELTFSIDAGATAPSTESLTINQFRVSGPFGNNQNGQTDDGEISISSGPQAGISLSGNGAFGGVEAGDSDNRTFTVENDGDPGTTLELSSIDVTGDPEFSHNGGTCTATTTLATGATCTVIVEFAPGATGTFNGDLAVGSNAGTENIALTGQGTAAQPSLNVTGTNLLLQGTDEGESVSGVFTASNNGPAATSIVVSNCSIDTDPSGSATVDPAGATLAGGEAQQFTITATAPAVGQGYTVEAQCDFESFDSDGTSIGTGTIDVTANVSTRPAVIPTLSNVGMVLFAMLIGLVGLVVVRQRA